MNRQYEFLTDMRARAFCDEIVEAMKSLFGMSEEEAIGRINGQWRGLAFEREDLRFHEEAEFWANDIFYGHDSYWWTRPAGLQPKPYP